MPGRNGFEVAQDIQRASAQPPKLVLLTAFDQQNQAAQALSAGFAAYLTKPVKQSMLFDTLLGITIPPPARAVPAPATPATPPPSSAPDSGQPLLLIAEDNPVNQRLALLQIQRLGYRADVVQNGVEAVAAVARQRYAAVLMDCQMPIMDGFGATAAIRRGEAKGDARLPIIAMTANAMQGDREACLAAGMDDYLSKPVNLSELQQLLQHWVVAAAPEPATAAAVAAPPAVVAPVLDPAAISSLRSLQDARSGDFVGEMVAMFLEDSAVMMASIARAVQEQQAADLQMAAHTLKGSAANLGATAVVEHAKELETLGRSQQLDAAPAVLSQLQQAYLVAQGALQELIKQD